MTALTPDAFPKTIQCPSTIDRPRRWYGDGQFALRALMPTVCFGSRATDLSFKFG